LSVADRWRRIYFLTPTFRPVGGVVKIFDYVNHAGALGLEAVICCPEPFKEDLPLFRISRFSGISPEMGFRFVDPENVSVGPHDLAFLSWPTQYEILGPRLSRWTHHEQVICIVQNVRWANPTFTNGYAIRLLSRPMARIMTNGVVLEAVGPYLNERSMTEIIDLGHDTAFFARERTGGPGPRIRVAYTTWKSDVGDRVAGRVRDPAFEFRAIRNPVGWEELRELYHWADVFLATPWSRRVSTSPVSKRWPPGRSCSPLTLEATGHTASSTKTACGWSLTILRATSKSCSRSGRPILPSSTVCASGDTRRQSGTPSPGKRCTSALFSKG